MAELQNNKISGPLTCSSSLEDDRWHAQAGCCAFERWHFDALSDDGREAVVITFHDNYAFSPRYFDEGRKENGSSGKTDKRFPAISFTYSIDGKVILRTVNEFRAEEFAVSENGIGCRIGSSSFRVDVASYGSGFFLQIDLLTARKRRVKAEFEWLSIDADLSNMSAAGDPGSPSWNIVAPRSDVSGRITLVGRRGKTRRLVHFRGTGYHDHFRSSRSLEETVGSRYWGRAHFIDSTAVFHYHEKQGEGAACAKLFLIRDGSFHEWDVPGLETIFERSRYGIKIPQRLSFSSTNNIRLRIKPVGVIQSGFFDARVLSEMTLTLRDGKARKTTGITELMSPARMRSRVLRRIADMRIGKNGNGPSF